MESAGTRDADRALLFPLGMARHTRRVSTAIDVLVDGRLRRPGDPPEICGHRGSTLDGAELLVGVGHLLELALAPAQAMP